jgi:hypothetical protein
VPLEGAGEPLTLQREQGGVFSARGDLDGGQVPGIDGLKPHL